MAWVWRTGRRFRLYRYCGSVGRSKLVDRSKVVFQRLIQPLVNGKAAAVKFRRLLVAGRATDDADGGRASLRDCLVSAAADSGQERDAIRRSLFRIDRHHVLTEHVRLNLTPQRTLATSAGDANLVHE